jgi:hypothetical protein
VKLVLLSGEELGLLGSNAFVEHAISEGRSIICAVNADMIGRPVSTDTMSLNVVSFLARSRFLDSVVAYRGRYGIGLSLATSIDSAGRSDHVPFTVARFDAISFGGGGDPYYHTSADTWEKVNPDLIRRGAQLMLATIAELAEPLGNAGAVDPSRTLPTVSMLQQNYPNPFNPTTRIRYTVARVVAPSGVEGRFSSDVKLAVYDLLGREVAVLVDEKKAPGTYDVQCDGSELASGVYFYRLTADGFVSTRRMLLLR